MPKVHHFQRYSSPENTVTNNTLQLLARINSYSTVHASRLLTELTGAPIEIGIEIAQQTRAVESVPDGTILQRSFKVLVEAKVDGTVEIGQLARHASSFGEEAQKVLLVLTKLPVNGSEAAHLVEGVNSQRPDVIVAFVTYSQICAIAKTLFLAHELEMSELVEDYVEYCNDTGLIDESGQLMRVVPCSKSLDLNRQYGIYFQPTDRGYTSHEFVGIYADKSVRVIWQIKTVMDVTLDSGVLRKEVVQGSDDGGFDEAIISIISDARRVCGYEVSHGHRFFCGVPHDTDFKKTSRGGIMGARFVNVVERLGEIGSPAEMAESLRHATWE